MKRQNYLLLVILVAGLSLATQLPALAATYYVAPNGDDSRSAAQAQNSSTPWKTLARAVSMAVAGDIVNFAAGNYPETATVFFSNSGTSVNPITFNGTGTVTFRCNIRIDGSYIVLNGLTISPAIYVQWEAVRLSGQHITMDNCTVKNYNACAGNQAVAITFNDGSAFNTVQNSTISDMEDIDAFHVWGHDQTIRNVLVTNLTGPHYDAGTAAPCGGYNHTDFFQTWGGWDGVSCYNILVENCRVIDCAIQLGNTANSNRPGLHDITFRNNVFANVDAAFFTGVPETYFYNNVFYNVGDAQGYAVSFYNQNNYSSAGSEFKNNVFLANIKDIDDHNGANNVTIANNYFANANYSAKTNGQPMGTNFINGGDPKFANVGGLDFHLLTGSPLINAGATLSPVFPDRDGDARSGSWDIGVDEFGVVDTQAPSVPAGLTSSNKTQTSFTLSWAASSDNVGVTGYEVFKNGVSIGTTTTTSMSVTGLSANTAYSMTVRARDAVPNWSAQSTALNVTTLAVGEVASSTTWQSFPISTQAGVFTAEFDAKPNTAGMDGIVGILNGTADEYSDNACSVRFNPGNTIDALNGGAYNAATTVGYSPGTSYHFRLVINVPNHTYSIYVTPQGQSEITLGTNYAFRTQQASVSQLTGWALYAATGTHTVSNVSFTASGDAQAPTVPTGLTASNKTQNSFTLSWTASTDNVGVTGYEVFKDGVSIGTTTTTSMSVTGLNANTTYSMRVRARDAVPNWSAQSSALNVTTGVTSSTSWQSFQISTHTQTFIAEFDAVPNSTAMNGVVGIVNGSAAAYADNACTVRFHESNTIQALNGSAYSSATTVNYTPGNSYHFRLVINIPNHTYSIYVTPQGQSEITLGTNYAFRTQQASVTQLTGWALLAEIGTHTVSNMSFSPVSGTVWQSFPVSTQTGVFTAEYDAVPNTAAMDGVVGILNGTATGYVDNACSIRFNPGNTIDALNGSAYNAAATVNYTPGASYHFRLVINVPNHTYSIYVTPPGQSEIALGTNYAFRTQQASVTQLTGWSLLSTNGTHTVSNVVFTSGSGRTRTSGDVASKAITLPYLGDKDAGVFNAEGKALIVYPNPTQSSLKIRMLSEPGKIQQISIYNSDGKEIVRRTIDSAEETIDTSSLPSGTYLIKLVSGNRLTVERFIVQH